MEEPVVFENKNGKKLFGIVHIPEQNDRGDKKIGVNLLNPGIKYRVAPNRLNVKLARKLCNQGYYVFRFDPEGVGDSQAELPEDLLVQDIWEQIQAGLFVADTIASNDFFVKNYEIDELILIGNCGGAITSLLASRKDRRVNGLCLIDIPINLRTAKMSFADKIAEGGEKADLLFSRYIKKMISLKSWCRFVTLKSEYRALLKISKMKIIKTFGLLGNDHKLSKDIEWLCNEKSLNVKFFKSVEEFIRKRNPILFVLAGNDSGTEIFKKYFQDAYLKEKYKDPIYEKLFEIFVVENANHVYTLSEWQELLINKILSWVSLYENSLCSG